MICTHVWVVRGFGTGTSTDTTIWGPACCVLCGESHPAELDSLSPTESDTSHVES